MRRQPECDHSGFEEAAASFSRYRQTFEQGIERLMRPHRPYQDEWPLRPGNSYTRVSFYCEKCRTPWPCDMFNDLRSLYGEVNEWPPATRPYEPLVLHLAAEVAATADGGAA